MFLQLKTAVVDESRVSCCRLRGGVKATWRHDDHRLSDWTRSDDPQILTRLSTSVFGLIILHDQWTGMNKTDDSIGEHATKGNPIFSALQFIEIAKSKLLLCLYVHYAFEQFRQRFITFGFDVSRSSTGSTQASRMLRHVRSGLNLLRWHEYELKGWKHVFL